MGAFLLPGELPKLAKRYISSILRLKLGCKTLGCSSNNIITVPHIPAAAHGYVLVNDNLFHEKGGMFFSLANLTQPTRIPLVR